MECQHARNDQATSSRKEDGLTIFLVELVKIKVLDAFSRDNDISPVGEFGDERSGVFCERVKCDAVQCVEHDLNGRAILATVALSRKE
jgi:hypothetical protein